MSSHDPLMPSNTSAVLRYAAPLDPPAAYILPFTTAAPAPCRAVFIDGNDDHALVVMLYCSALLRYPPLLYPPMTTTLPCHITAAWESRTVVIDGPADQLLLLIVYISVLA